MQSFNDLCNSIIESAEIRLNESRTESIYKLNPDMNSSSLAGMDKIVADFVELKPATLEELIDTIKSNLPEDSTSLPTEILRDLIDSNVLVLADNDTEEDISENPNEDDLKAIENDKGDTPTDTEDLDNNEPSDDEDSSPIPLGSGDEEDTFDLKNQISKDEDYEGSDEDETDDTPISDLIKKEKEQLNKSDRKKQTLQNLTKYIFNKRNKTPDQAQEYINRAKSKGIL